jgi:hypothetical protein
MLHGAVPLFISVELMKKPRLFPLVAVAVVALAAVAGCTPSAAPATPAPAPSPSASGTPTPSPSRLPVAERLVVDSQSLTVLADDGTALQSFTYFDPAADVVAALATLFAADPEVEDVQPYEGYPFTQYEWPGFSLNDSIQEPDGVYYVNFRIQITAATLNGIALETVEDISVGDDPLPIEAAHPDDVEHFTAPNIGHETFIVTVDRRALPDWVDDHGTQEVSFVVSVFGSVGGTVEHIYAPSGGGPGI